MIKFFRHIRKTLISENKMGKYFKYAIGEILLVVIGILIALQINNWNEQQKKNDLKQEYIVSLKNDYTKDTIQLNSSLRFNRNEQNKLNAGKARIANSEIKTIDDFSTMWGSAGGTVKFTNTYNNNSFNLLVSSGNIDLLDKQLREEIMELNRLQNYERSITTKNRDFFFEFMRDISKYPDPQNPFHPPALNDLIWKGVDKDAFVRDATTFLGQYEYTIKRYITLTETVVAQTEKVLILLNQKR